MRILLECLVSFWTTHNCWTTPQFYTPMAYLAWDESYGLYYRRAASHYDESHGLHERTTTSIKQELEFIPFGGECSS
jgi:hypothetical protein